MSEPRITPDQVSHVAKLSRLALDQEHLQKYAGQLVTILEYVGQLRKVQVEGVEPMAHPVPLFNVLRDDAAGPTLSIEQVMRNAPEADRPFFKVPKIIGGDEDSVG